MPEVSATAMTDVLSSNITDDKRVALFTFLDATGSEQTIALPVNQLSPLVDLAMIQLGKTELGAEAKTLIVDNWQVARSGEADKFALIFHAPNGGRIAHTIDRKEIPKLRDALKDLETELSEG